MSASNLVKDIDGVSRCVVGDTGGRILERQARDSGGEDRLRTAAFLSSQLKRFGATVGIGTPSQLSIAGNGCALFVALRNEHVFVVECDSLRSANNVEASLASSAWETLVEAEAPVAEPEAEPIAPPPIPEEPRPIVPPRLTVPRPEGRIAAVPRPPPRTRSAPAKPPQLAARPPALRPPSRTVVVPSQSEQRELELRRALIKGQLKQAEVLSAELHLQPKARNGESDMASLPGGLLEGIAMVLAGDAFGGFASLKVVESSAKSLSICWVSKIWCARASIRAGVGSDTAHSYASSAIELATQLDNETRAVSMVELADIVFHQEDAIGALQLTRSARELFSSGSDSQLMANCWLLEARILMELGNHAESVAAARNARDKRPSWPAPATFIAKLALQEGRLDDAEQALHLLLSKEPGTAEVERTHRLIEYVRSGVTPAAAAFEFLDLVDAPPSAENVQGLKQLADAYPGVTDFQIALGWQLLRVGQYDDAKSAFDGLAASNDIPEDARASVLLALGCLASASAPSAKPESRLRAAVDAAPKNLSSNRPPARSSGKIRAASPIDFRSSDLPPAGDKACADRAPNGIPERRGSSGRSVFSGNLQLFSLPDLLEFLRSGQRTGTLVCSSTAGIGAIQLRRGRITGAASPKAKGLTDYLIAMGVLTRDDLQKLEPVGVGEPTLIGGTLVKTGLASTTQVRLALHDQVHDAVRELMSWGAGQFAFEPEPRLETSDADVPVEFDSQEVLLNIFKEMDEKSR